MAGKNQQDAFWWSLFGVGGTLAAFLLPVHIFLLGIAMPLGWIEFPGYETIMSAAEHPLMRLYIFALISLSLFHWAHRFRYTLYDGLMLKHLGVYIKILCYGTAIAGTILAGVLVVLL